MTQYIITTRKEAQVLVNRERELYDAMQIAWHEWTSGEYDETYLKYERASSTWECARDEVRQARLDYPHLFAPFAEVTK